MRVRPAIKRSWAPLSLAMATLLLAGCERKQNFLYTAGRGAESIAWLSWSVFITFVLVTIVMWGLILWIMLRRRGSFDTHEPFDAGGGHSWMAIGGFAIPLVILSTFFVLSLRGMAEFPLHDDHADHNVHPPDIRVIGHQWWWEVQYVGGPPDQRFTTANEIHIPVGIPVNMALETADVLHSFWVPKLQGKVDMVPGYVNNLRLEASHVGTYRGQCSQYCGAQHAHMAVIVVAESPEDYEAWRAHMAQPAAEPSTPQETRGREVFLSAPCGNCHMVRGTPAGGTVAPNLTHLASRQGLAANDFPNDTADLEAWITHAQSLKPEVAMPNITQFSGEDLRAMVAYLEILK
ncbi:MAG TPA: cytochrome c oxidase subunit II [Bryobacteraceae bacterium]|nr:cytochrome c oxidase subunit II [Bryobacteraceae bacterium]